MELNKVPVLILAGGLGTRLRPIISDRPKVLAPLGHTTVLDFILEHLFALGLRDITLCVGYMKEKVRAHINDRSIPKDAIVSFSEEDSPLGTGGAIKKALQGCRAEMALVLNGDTIFPVDYALLLDQHTKNNADVSIALCEVEHTGRFGTVITDDTGRIIGFKEKDATNAAGMISAGVYTFKKDVIERFELPAAFSLEKDFFEKHTDEIRMHGLVFSDDFIDIGLPEDHAKAHAHVTAGRHF